MLGMFKAKEIENFQKELLKDDIDKEKLQNIIDKGIDINQKDEKGRTFLFTLVDKRKIQSIKLLVENNVDLFSEDMYGKNVLDEAISKQDGVMIRFLIDNGFDINHQNSSNRSALQDVALEGDFKIFEILATYSPNFDLKDSYGKTVLFDAINGENPKILREVVNNIEDINICNEHNQTALFLAVLKEDINLAHMLVMYGVSLNHIDKNGQNVLFNAILKGDEHLEFIKLLIKRDININQIDNEDKTILDEILHILELQRINKNNLEGKYDLIVGKTYEKITSLLIDNKLDINRLDEDGNTILSKQIQNQNYENIDFLLKCGVDINIRDKKGKTVLFDEVLKGYSNYKMIKYLIQNGADIQHRDDEGYCIWDYLIEAILINSSFKEKVSFFDFTQIKEDGEYDILLKKILSLKPKINGLDSQGRNILFKIVDYNHYDLLTLLINYGINVNLKDNDGKTILHTLVENGLQIKDEKEKDDFIKRLVFLLKFRVNVNIQDNEGKTVYHKAVLANDFITIEKLLTKKANLNLKDNQGQSALHHTKWSGNNKIARLLIAAGANMNQVDSAGFSLLNYAAVFGQEELIFTLLNLGVLMYNKNEKNEKVALFLKQKEKNLDKLLQTNLKDEKMKNALKQVVENTRREINEAIKG